METARATTLAIRGGTPVRDREWPVWPEADELTELRLLSVLRTGRWTISWPTTGEPALERQFADRFAAYCGVPHAVSVDHGSSALVLALEALDIGPGDEVVVPVMTWVATASAVLRVGAVPVLADVDPATGCLTAGTVRAAITGRTRAVIVVHLACTVADLDALLAVTSEAGIALVEDCAQAHGARWRGRPVGSWGVLGAFSFQNGKVLAGGEGGAVTTHDERLARRVQQLRADSRAYAERTVAREMEIVEAGEVIGANYCMSEFHAAVLLDQLERLDEQHERRERFARALESALAGTPFGPVPLPAAADRRSIYEYGIRFEAGTFGAAPVDAVAAALSAELGRAVYPPDAPLSRSTLFRPETKRRFAGSWRAAPHAVAAAYPGAETYRDTTLLVHHSALLGGDDDVSDVVAALEKVRDGRGDLGA